MTDTPQLTHEQVAEIAQEHEDFLNQLESLAISAIASGDWSEVYDHINFYAPEHDITPCSPTGDISEQLAT